SLTYIILAKVLSPPSQSCDSGVPIPCISCDSGVPIPSQSCDSGAPIPPYHVIQVLQFPPSCDSGAPIPSQSCDSGGHLGNKSIRDISWLLNIPRSTVSGIITKWKQLGTTATQPPSGRPRHMTGRGQRMLKRTVRRSRQLSAESIAKDLQTWCGLQMSPTTVRRELHGMGFHGRAAASKPSITKCNAKRRMPWCKARRHWNLEQWRGVL
ncbi:unnamed protein product, partial [Staurois parvus]